MIVTLAHLRTVPGFGKKPGFCASGSRDFFTLHSLDWNAFINQGLPEELFLATNDALALALVEYARKVGDL